MNDSLSCSTSASVVHFCMSVCGNLWWKMFVACAPSERYMWLFVLLSASSHGMLSTCGPLSSRSLQVFCQSVRLLTFLCSLCLLSAVVSSDSAGS